MREHIPKRNLDFENPIRTNKQFDNTEHRIWGEIQITATNPTSSAWGTGKNVTLVQRGDNYMPFKSITIK